MAGEVEATTMGDRIARAGYKGRRLAEVINEALQAERERVAKIAKAFCDQFDKPSEQFKSDLTAAIREGKQE